MEEEIWKDIEGYEGKYLVSTFGRVRSLCYLGKKGDIQILKSKVDKYGYMEVCLCKGSRRHYYRIHRLVSLAFIPNPDNLPIINHKDEDKTNNHVSNLEWCDNLYNLRYGTRKQRVMLTQRGYYYDKITIDNIEYNSIKEAADKLGLSSNKIFMWIKEGKAKVEKQTKL